MEKNCKSYQYYWGVSKYCSILAKNKLQSCTPLKPFLLYMNTFMNSFACKQF